MKVRFTATPHLNTGAITLQTEHSDLFGNFHRSMTVEIMRTKDDAVQQALIALGWTPPGEHPTEPNQAAVESALELADHTQNGEARYLIGNKLRPHMQERENYDATALRLLAAEVRHLRASLKAEVFAADPTNNTLESSIRAASNEARQRGIDQEYPTTKPNPPQPGPESEPPTLHRTMTAAQILPHLEKWEAQHQCCDRAWRSLEDLTQFTDSESPIGRAIWGTFDAYTTALASILDDQGEGLHWYAWENDMGSKALQAAAPHKKLRPIRNLRDLARLLAHK